MTRWLIALFLFATPALAQNPVEPERFDGAWGGDARLNAAMSGGGCAPGGPVSLTVDGGRFDQTAPALDAQISGFVTTDGFVTAQVAFSAGGAAEMEGRIVNDVMKLALFAEGAERCVYIIDLSAN